MRRKKLFLSIDVNLGKIWISSFSSTLDIVAYHIWAFVVAARGSRSGGHFWSLARCRISVFEILPLGGAKLFSLDIILEEICILFSHSWQNIGGEYTFLSRYCWLCCGISFQWSAKGRSPQTRLGFSKKYFSSACSIVSKCTVWAHWVVWAKSYNIQRNNATKTFTVTKGMHVYEPWK